jgi:hypothetical protein
MNYDQLWMAGEKARRRDRFMPNERHFIVEIVPRDLSEFPKITIPTRATHPAGFSLSGAPVRTFLKSVLVLSAHRALGPRFDRRSEFYNRVAADLAFGIMRSHFHHGHPKGTYCCAQCTLAVYPVLRAGALPWFDCQTLANTVRGLIERKRWRFSNSTNPRMVAWALE